MTDSAPSLLAMVIRRIMIFSAIAMAAQFIAVFFEYWQDQHQLGRLAIERETTALAAGLESSAGTLRFVLPDAMAQQYGDRSRGYFARVRRVNGTVLFSNCDVECTEHFLPLAINPPSFWMRQIRPGLPLYVAGGQVIEGHEQSLLIEVAIIGDTDGVVYGVLAHEVADHMAVPMSLILIIVLGATSLSIMQAFKPVTAAATLAARLDPLTSSTRIPTAKMPREVSKLVSAINMSLDRVHELVRAQKVFVSAISHDVRTPLAVARLELGNIPDPRARKVERDLEALNRLVEQLTTLGRLESQSVAQLKRIDPLPIAEAVVSALAPLAFEAGKSIELVDFGALPCRGNSVLVENALRNLIDNAIRHSGAGAHVIVEVGPGTELSVRDSGGRDPVVRPGGERTPAPGVDAGKADRHAGLGLKIVSRIARLQGGSLSITATAEGGFRASLKLSA